MGEHSDLFRDALATCNVEAMRRLHALVFPHAPAPQTDFEVLASIHLARTQAASIPKALRVYSHHWLAERSLPSALPDEWRREAERPRVVEGVGIAVGAASERMKPLVVPIREAMEQVVQECYDSGQTDVAHVRRQMKSAHDRALARLLGSTRGG